MTRKTENYIPQIKWDGINTNKNATFGGTVTLNGNVIGYATSAQYTQGPAAAASWAVSTTIFVNDSLTGSYQVAAVSEVHGTASTSGTLQVEVATGTQAIGAGTNQLTGTMSLSGTANTPVTGTLIASPTTITAGSRVNLIFAGTVTNLANATINVILRKTA